MAFLRRKPKPVQSSNTWSWLGNDELFSRDSQDQWGPVPLSRDPEELAEQVARLRNKLTQSIQDLGAASDPKQWEADVREQLRSKAVAVAGVAALIAVIVLVFKLRRRRRR